MTYRGHVENGVVVFDDEIVLPEGTQVQVDLILPVTEDAEPPSLYERLKPVIGMAEGLPSDLAQNHDHYLHGRAKQ